MNNTVKVHKAFMLLKRNFSQINLAKMLTDEHKKRTMEHFIKYTKLRFGDKNPESHAAILCPICINNDSVSLLYTLRSSKLRNFSRQVSFPGGVMDDTDGHEIECALRETEEEVGIKSKYIKVWGAGSQITPLFGPSIVPIIAEIQDFSPSMLKRNPDEVEKIFNVDLNYLIDSANMRHTQFRKGYSMPIYVCDEKIWGMTAIITHFLLCSLLPRTLYSRRVNFVGKYTTT